MLKYKLVLKTLSIALLSSLLFILSNCSNGNAPESTTIAVDSLEISEDIETQSYLLPTPLQMAYIFRKSGLKYESGITNTTANASKYSSTYGQSLNLGVYSSDMAYCVLNNQSQEAITYLKTVKNLSDKLGMSSAFNSESLVERFEKSISNHDSIMLILSEIQSKSEEVLTSNDKKATSAIIFTGAWVESMYIGLKVAVKTKDKKFSPQVIDQMGILDNLIKALKSYEAKDVNITGLITDLNSIKDVYNNFEGVKKLLPDDEAAMDMEISDTEISDLSKKIEELRNKIVNG